MSKHFWISPLALILLATSTAWAEDRVEAPKPETREEVEVRSIGPIRVEIETRTKAEPGQQEAVNRYEETIRKILVNGQPVDVPGGIVGGTVQIGGEQIRVGEYWIGVGVRNFRPFGDEFRGKLPEGVLAGEEGLLVQSVVPDSPAAKAGIKKDDVLLKANDKPLKDVKDLVDVVNEAKDKELAIELLRAGEQQEIARQKLTVTPVKRPADSTADWEKILRWFEQFQGEAREGQSPMRFRIFRPGTILPPGALLQHTLPDDMTVTITKTGKNTAQLTVKQGDKTWEVAEDQMDKLPPEVRMHVERLLGHMPFNIRLFQSEVAPQPPLPVPPLQPPGLQPGLPGFPPQLEGRLEKRLDEMNQRIDKLNRSIDEMRQKAKENLPRPKSKKLPAEKKAETPAEPRTL